MMPESKRRLNEFLNAIDEIGSPGAGPLAACHHSAVEVNDWPKIQAAMAVAARAADGGGEPKPL
jgi:hypothetical protein